MIKTKSLKDNPKPADGLRILVTRYSPRESFKSLKIDLWLRKPAPSSGLLKDWKEGKITEDEYEVRYRHEMNTEQEAVSELASMARYHVVTLLCFEPEGKFCHRHILRSIVESKLREYQSQEKPNE